jgi:2-polyprenyl-3-methyl-5-hydroxy-6-metoxy-1,4-benzoquinol methylase
VSDAPRKVELDADAYDARWARLAEQGEAVHGEAELVERLLRDTGVVAGARVLDAGCGTGRVAIRLAARGFDACGVDVDDALLAHARTKAPTLAWHHADLAHLDPDHVPGPFDAIVLAGNVMIFLAPGTESAVLRNLADRLAPGGMLVAGFQLRAGGLTVGIYDDCTLAAGLESVAHFSTWDATPFEPGGDYVVAVSKR